MQINFGSPPDSVDDIHIQSYLDSFDCKQKISIIICAKLVNSKYLFSEVINCTCDDFSKHKTS